MAEGEKHPTDTIRRILLQLPKRRRIYEAIVATPGTHVRRLCRDLDMPLGNVEHHVRQLEKHEVIFSHQSGRRRTYYAEHIEQADVAAIHALRKPGWGELMHALLECEANVAALARRVNMPPTTVSYQLRRMQAAGLLENFKVGRESVYLVIEPERIRRLMKRLHLEADGGAPDPSFMGLLQRARPDLRRDEPKTDDDWLLIGNN